MENVVQGKGQAALNLCGCGKLHFTYGPVTLHFEREEFQAFAETVCRLAYQSRHIVDMPNVTTVSPGPGSVCH